jgi:hypothetical protein
MKFHITIILIFAIGIGCGTYLAVSNHPWFALLAFILTAITKIRDGKTLKVGENAKQTVQDFSILRGGYRERLMPVIDDRQEEAAL